jgi:hypothetical protein
MSTLQRALQRLVERDSGGVRPGGLPGLSPHVPIPAARGLALSADTAGAPGGGGFAETDAALREYWPEQIVASSDGVFVLRIAPIKTLYLDNGQVASFADPAAPPADDA